MNTTNMPVPVKKSPPSHELFATYVKFIAGCLTGNSDCPDPTPSVASLISQADALAQANVKAKGNAPGAVADRNAKRKHLEGDLDHLIDHVKVVIKAQALDPVSATKLILSIGLSVRKSSSFAKPPLAARDGKLPGEVKLMALTVAGAAMYFWEHSVDGVAWTSAPGTTGAKTTLSGLSAGQTYFFRFHAHTPKGMGPSSDPVKWMVR